MDTVDSITTCIIRINTGTAEKTEIANTATIDAADRAFDFRLMAPFSRQSRMTGPNALCESSQSWAVLEDFPNKNAASSKKGTVGRIGRKTPTTAAITHKHPRINQISRIV